MQGKPQDRRRRERGSALAVTLFLTLIVTALCTTLLLTSSADSIISGNDRDGERALFASRAGLSYGYYLLVNDLVAIGSTATPFDSFDTVISDALEEAQFTGEIAIDENGLHRITSTGTYRRASRTTEIVLQLTADIFNYGMVGFNDVLLEVHTTDITAPADVTATIFANNAVNVGMPIDLTGTVVSSGSVQVLSTAGDPTTIDGDVFAYQLDNDGSITGEVGFLTSLKPADDSPNITDDLGNEYEWYLGRSNPDSAPSGSGSVSGGVSRTVVVDGDHLDFSIFRADGTLHASPSINAIRYVPPPKLDYGAMKAVADENDPTYFLSAADALAYLAGKKVTETIGGQLLTTIKVGTPVAPEFLYVRGDLSITLDPDAAADNLGAGLLKADGLHIEGGIYTSGDFSFTGQVFDSPDQYPEGYNQLGINALPYCYPAIIAYSEPASGTIATWTVDDTPPIMTGNQSEIQVRSDVVSPQPQYQGPIYISGLTYAESESHFHHSEPDKDLITLNGGQLAFRVHNCDFYDFNHDPAVRCTRFLAASGASGSGVFVSYREIR